MPNGNGARKRIFVLSDGTGIAALRIAEAALRRYPGAEEKPKAYPDIQTVEEVRQIMEKAAREGAFVIYTLDPDDLREEAATQAKRLRLEVEDLTGHLIERIGRFLREEPASFSGRHMSLDDLARRTAFEFALLHDDGKLLRDMRKAHAVIIGLSRTSKTDVCYALSERGVLAANVPVTLEEQVPVALKKRPRHVFVLWAHSTRMQDVRESRAVGLRAYADEGVLEEEQALIRRLRSANPEWTAIDTTKMLPEDVADLICRELHKRFKLKILPKV